MKANRRLLSIFFAICLMITSVCFFRIETDAFVMPENMTSTPSYTIETDSVIASGDACTLEMLGNQNFSLVSQQAVTRNCDSLRKAVEHGMIFDNIVLLQPSLHVFDFVTTDTLLDESEVAQIILFIHNKDGKK